MARVPVQGRISTPFGVADSNAAFGRHSGIDIAVALNTPILAPADGTIQNIKSTTGGNMVVLFDGTHYHRLMHNSAFTKPHGAWVREGDEVAKAGSTGLSTGVHCHWDISAAYPPRSFASFINPADWLAQGDDMIKPEDAAPLRILHSEIGGWDVGSTHAGKHDQAFISAWAGKSWRACIEAQWKAGESFRNMREKLLVEFNNARLENAKLTRTVGELETTIAAQKKQIDDTAMMLASMKSAADNALSDTPALPDPATPKEPSWFVRLLAKLLVPKG